MAAIDTQLIARELPQLIGREVAHMSVIMRREVDHRAIETLFVGECHKIFLHVDYAMLIMLTLLLSVSPYMYLRCRWLDVLDDEAKIVNEKQNNTNHVYIIFYLSPSTKEKSLLIPESCGIQS